MNPENLIHPNYLHQKKNKNGAECNSVLSGTATSHVDHLLHLEALLSATQRYDFESSAHVRLIPTEGLMSPMQKKMYLSMQCERYLHAPPENSVKAIAYPDIGQLQAIYGETCEVIRRAFDSPYVCPDYLSGLNAVQLMIISFTNPGDLILTVSDMHGGHSSTKSIVSDLGRMERSLPFDSEKHEVAVTQLDTTLNPSMVLLDHSNILKASNYKAIKESYPNATVAVDISQVMALVVSKHFPNPLECGGDLIFGSTHKSMNGPQKAIAITRKQEVWERLKQKASVHISNNHPASVAALGICFLEFELFGADYGRMLLQCAQELAVELSLRGVSVYGAPERCFTSSQHVWIDVEKCSRLTAIEAMQRLYEVGIVVNTLFLPMGGKRSGGARGLRLGTTEVVRLGMGLNEMRLIATWIADTIFCRLPTNQIRHSVLEMRKQFQKVSYCIPDNRCD